MNFIIDSTDVEVKLGIDDLQPNELGIAYRRGYQEGRLSAKDLYESCKELLSLAVGCWRHGRPEFDKARRVIAKAEAS